MTALPSGPRALPATDGITCIGFCTHCQVVGVMRGCARKAG